MTSTGRAIIINRHDVMPPEFEPIQWRGCHVCGDSYEMETMIEHDGRLFCSESCREVYDGE